LVSVVRSLQLGLLAVPTRPPDFALSTADGTS